MLCSVGRLDAFGHVRGLTPFVPLLQRKRGGTPRSAEHGALAETRGAHRRRGIPAIRRDVVRRHPDERADERREREGGEEESEGGGDHDGMDSRSGRSLQRRPP